jgi:hypothetical protein
MPPCLNACCAAVSTFQGHMLGFLYDESARPMTRRKENKIKSDTKKKKKKTKQREASPLLARKKLLLDDRIM